MLNKKFWQAVFKKQGDFDVSRRKIIGESAMAQHLGKQAIFALQRDNKKEAEEKLAEATKILVSLDKRFGKDFRLRMEGAWKAAVEEYAEGKLFSDFYNNKSIGEIKEFNVEADEFIGALSDVSGEIVRSMVIWTTKGEIVKVKKAAEAINEIIHELMQYNYGGYLRTKFDQAKKNLNKAEEILYDLSIRNK
jgi:predicted translin family RNA/ssDNA-binding protein